MHRYLVTNRFLAVFVFTLFIASFTSTRAQELDLDKNFYNITFNQTALYAHNQQKNVECNVESKELYRYTPHNFNTPIAQQTIAKPGRTIKLLKCHLKIANLFDYQIS